MSRQERGDGRGGDEPCSQGSCTVLEKNGKLFGLTNLLEAQERPSGDGTGEQEVGRADPAGCGHGARGARGRAGPSAASRGRALRGRRPTRSFPWRERRPASGTFPGVTPPWPLLIPPTNFSRSARVVF